MPRQRSIALTLNGYTDLPPGKIAAIVTYLEMRERPRLRRLPAEPGWVLERLRDETARYRALFRSVGEDWLWFSRLHVTDAQLTATIGHPDVEAYALVIDGRDSGLLELDFRPEGECELAYFGVVPEAVGRGTGRRLMNEAVRRAFRRPIGRFFVHTCTLDHPNALPFYMRSGFTPYKRAIEVADDPRLRGALPLAAAPHVPVIGSPETTKARQPVARPRKTIVNPSS